MGELTLHVEGMACRRCVREVTARLRDVSGVETVCADARRSQVRLSGSMTTTDVVRALAGTDYVAHLLHLPSTGVEPQSHNGHAEHSPVSAAIAGAGPLAGAADQRRPEPAPSSTSEDNR